MLIVNVTINGRQIVLLFAVNDKRTELGVLLFSKCQSQQSVFEVLAHRKVGRATEERPKICDNNTER